MKKALLLALLIALATTPGIAQQATQSAKNKAKLFSHELSLGYGYLNVPTREWHHLYQRKWMPTYEFGYNNKYFLKTEYICRLSFTGVPVRFWTYHPPSEGDFPDYMLQRGAILSRYFYRLFDVTLGYNLLPASSVHGLHANLGVTWRKTVESRYFDRNEFELFFYNTTHEDYGLAAGLSYSYNFLRYGIAGAELCYRTYNRGDALLTGNIKLGILLRH